MRVMILARSVTFRDCSLTVMTCWAPTEISRGQIKWRLNYSRLF